MGLRGGFGFEDSSSSSFSEGVFESFESSVSVDGVDPDSGVLVFCSCSCSCSGVECLVLTGVSERERVWSWRERSVDRSTSWSWSSGVEVKVGPSVGGGELAMELLG